MSGLRAQQSHFCSRKLILRLVLFPCCGCRPLPATEAEKTCSHHRSSDPGPRFHTRSQPMCFCCRTNRKMMRPSVVSCPSRIASSTPAPVCGSVPGLRCAVCGRPFFVSCNTTSVAVRCLTPGSHTRECQAHRTGNRYKEGDCRTSGPSRSSLLLNHDVVVTRHSSGRRSRPTPPSIWTNPLQYGRECGTQTRKPFVKAVRCVWPS